MRIAVLGTRGIPGVMGGIETHCQELYPRLVRMGHSITVFGRRDYLQKRKPYDYSGVQVVPIWAPRIKTLEAITHTLYGFLRVLLSTGRFDLIHIHGIGPSLVVPIARIFRIKIVMTHHGPDYERKKWGFFASAILKVGERVGCKYANAVIVVSQHIRKQVESFCGTPPNYIPNGVNVAELVPPGEELGKWGLKPRKYILSVGRLVPEKGFHDLLDAFRRQETEWLLVIAGDADHEDKYSRSFRDKAAADPRVVMTGFIKGKAIAEIFSNAGLFVLPSYHEGLPIVLLEAMSYGLPLLVSDIPANQELVEKEEIFPVGNVDALSEAIQQRIDSITRYLNAKDRMKSEYNWDHVAGRIEDVFISAVKSK